MWAVEAFGLPIKNVLQGLAGGGDGGGGGGALGPQSAAFYAPGSIVRTKVDVTSPIAYGSEPESIAWFEQSPAFELSGNARSIVSYAASGSPLLSGWLLGAEKLNGKSAVVEVPVGQGRVILFGFRPHTARRRGRRSSCCSTRCITRRQRRLRLQLVKAPEVDSALATANTFRCYSVQISMRTPPVAVPIVASLTTSAPSRCRSNRGSIRDRDARDPRTSNCRCRCQSGRAPSA